MQDRWPTARVLKKQFPDLVFENENLKVWHKVDDTFKTPRAVVAVAITTTTTYVGAREYALASLVVRLLHDSIQEELYLADVAGLQSSISLLNHKIEIKLSGFDEKIATLLGTILDRMMGTRSLCLRPMRRVCGRPHTPLVAGTRQ